MSEALTSDYIADLEARKGKRRDMGVSVLGPSASGKTFEIESSLRGMGVTSTTSTDETNVRVYSIGSAIPIEGYESASVIFDNRIANLAVRDLIGQYEQLEKVDEEGKVIGMKDTAFFNIAKMNSAKVFEIVVDSTRPGLIKNIKENWLRMIKESRKSENAEFSIYISKSRIPESVIKMDDIISSNYSSLERIKTEKGLTLDSLIDEIGKQFGKKPMVFVGDMDCSINGEQHQRELFLVKAGYVDDSNKVVYGYLPSPVQVLSHATKVLPALRYAIINKETTNSMESLTNKFEDEYGFKITGY